MNEIVEKKRGWSLSAVGCYEKCQLKAKYKYVDRLPEARGEAADRGVNFHKTIEDFITGKSPNLPSNLDYYTGWFTELKKHEIYPEHVITLNDQWEKAKEGEPYWYKGILDLKVLLRSTEHLLEQPVREGSTDQVAAGGTTEVVSRDAPTEAIIYDWKTGKIYPDHHDQRTLYSLATFAEHPTVQRVRAIHVYVDLRQLREETFDRNQMHELRKSWEDRANRFLDALKNPETMIPNPGWNCRYCAFSVMKGGPCRF